jgi:uncharacterized protein YicC (UPF0701 family)
LRELVAASVKRGKVELRLAPTRDSSADACRCPPESLLQPGASEAMVQGWLPKAASLTVQRGAAVVPGRRFRPSGQDEAALSAAREALQGPARRRASAKALAWRPCSWTGWLICGYWQRAPGRWCRGCAAPARAFSRALERSLAASGAVGSVPTQALQERALNEAAAFAIRIDVAEELARLASHLDEIERLLKAGGELGKRLDFLIQELHREANTLGAKSAALELTAVSVDMKVLVEQMREQVQNIE